MKRGASIRREDPLDTNVQYVKSVGPRIAELLSRLDVRTVRDLLYLKPRTWQDRSGVVPIAEAVEGASGMFMGRIIDAKLRRGRSRKSVFEILIADSSGELDLTWFNQPYMADVLNKAEYLLVWGKVGSYRGLPQIVAPEYEIVDDTEATEEDRSGIVPVYPLTEGLNQRRMRRIAANCLETYRPKVVEFLDEAVRGKRELMSLDEALGNLHFPESDEAKARALRRLKYDELFLLEAAMGLRRQAVVRSGGAPQITVTDRVDERIRRLFDFKFTSDQDKVIEQLKKDLALSSPMNRLLQGDVGSGKTVIAIYAMLSAVAAKHQAALMAPTEVLAEQHHRTLSKLLRKARVKFALLTGGVPAAEKESIKTAAAAGELDLLIGTHSLIEGTVDFARLGLVVMDEQHKFGVVQRAKLKRKGANPHTLVMTATPIPRTLMLTVFGDLDVSILEKSPPGRGEITTRWVPPEKRGDAFAFIRGKLVEGRQAFFVYPLIEGSEKTDVKSAVDTARELRSVFGEFGVQLVTGAMSSKAKSAAMRDFRSGKARILVATVVIEVGIDIPNASIMVVENAERFGLSQLHQLRGRIGRGRHRSYCLLFGEPTTEDARRRLEVMAETNDGFRIAEEDLKLRGPGEFFGTRQHGLPEFAFADLIEDWKLLQAAREDAFAVVEEDPGLARHTVLRSRVRESCGDRLDLAEAG